MFNYGNANEAQKEAISATDGLVLITAGPGTGKTFTLVKRAVYLIQECGIQPEQIMMATFTEKAAKELITRITNELAERNISVNVNEMYIGTFHSLCLRIIKENLEFTRLKRNYRLLDTFDQKYLVFRNFHKFKNIEGIDELLSKGGSWKRSDEICTYINHLSEEMVDIEALQSDDNPGIRTLGRVLSVYQEMLEEGNLIDFSTIQTECYKLLMQNKQILEELQDKLQYLMIDEYQDTNYIQEQIVFLLGAKHHNICVVGDDDQGLYRFRGATIRNILEFPHKFENEGCKIIPLVVNYRSNSDIVDFYNEWISTTSGHKFKFSWDRYRYQKKIEPHVKSDIQSPAVVKLFSKDDEDEWHEKILGFIKELKESGKLTDRVLKELKHYVADSVVQKSYASPIKDLVRDKMVEYSKYAIDRAEDVFFYEVIPNVWHKHIVPLWKGAKDVLFSKELKIDQIKCETEHKVVENQPILSEIMTKEEVDAEKRKLLYHWIGLLSSLTKLQNAGELDVESTLAQLTEPMMIERVNALLSENPNLLETDKYILLHSLLGRDLYMEGRLIPIRATEINMVAKNNGGLKNGRTNDF